MTVTRMLLSRIPAASAASRMTFSVVALVVLVCGGPAHAAPAAAPAPAVLVEVTAFEVTGNTLLPTAELMRALQPFTGRRGLGELETAAQVVQRLYAIEGYGGVVAYLPPQKRNDGIVSIAVVEGRLAPIVIRGGQVFHGSGNVKASLPDLAPGTTPRLWRVDTQLQIANENPAKNLRVLLKPGQQTGEVEAEVTVRESSLQRLTFSAENTGNRRTGRYRAAIAWQHASLTGQDDVLTAQYQTSPSQSRSVTVLSAGYRYPIYSKLMVVDAFVATSDVDGGVTGTPAGDLHFSGNGRIAGARATWYLPRLGEADQRLSLGLDQRVYRNRCAITGLPAGACGSAGESVAVQPLGIEYSLLAGGDTAWGFSLSLNRNLQWGGSLSDSSRFEAVRPGAKPRYTALRYAASAQWPLAETWQWRTRITGQASRAALVSGEQFGLGGALSVRGYEEREITGDSGWLFSTDLSTPDWLALGTLGPAALRGFVFGDAGLVRNRLGTPCLGVRSRCTLASWGLGARFEWQALQARLAVARALRDAIETGRGDVRWHFFLSYTF